jgi:broad specificity phosphatase PhoE
MLVYVVRHGESEDDLSDSYGGAADFRLTDRGRSQAATSAEKLAGKGVQALYASPLARAAESAEIIGSHLGLSVETVFDLRERNTYGVLSGHTRQQAQELFGYVLKTLDYIPGEGTRCAPGGEEYNPFIERVRSAFRYVVEAAQAAGHDQVAIVTHGKFTKGLFREVLRLSDEYDSSHASINVVDYSSPSLVKNE